LADFQKLLHAYTTELVVPGVKVVVVLDTSKIPAEDTHDAVIVMNSVKPVKLTPALKVEVAGANQTKSFQYSVPFTQEGGVHAKSIDQQWKRTTTLEVEEPFPSLNPRQLVVRQTIKVLNPLENSIDDINIRLEAMLAELKREKKDGADTNNLMRIVQGSVMPQVNGGAVQVAQVLLGGEAATTSPELTTQLSVRWQLHAYLVYDTKSFLFRKLYLTSSVCWISCSRNHASY
jgi:hypothetical protein